MIKTTDFKQYFDSIKNNLNKKLGELEKAPGKITAVQEYKSPKSGKESIKLTINVNDVDIFAYLGYGSDKSAEISKGRLVKLSVAAVGMEETKKLYESAANDEDVETDAEFIVEFATKLNKKIKKNPVDVIVNRKKEGDFWDNRWFLPDASEPEVPAEQEAKAEDGEKFLEDLVDKK